VAKYSITATLGRSSPLSGPLLKKLYFNLHVKLTTCECSISSSELEPYLGCPISQIMEDHSDLLPS